MRIRQQKNHGNWRWVVDYRDGKGRRRQKFFEDSGDAHEFAGTVTGQKKTRAKGGSFTIEDVCERYAEDTRSRRKQNSHDSLRYELRTICEVLETLGYRSLHQITPRSLHELHEGLKARLADTSAHHGASTWRSVMRHAVQRGWLDERQVGDARLPSPQQPPQRWLRKGEITRLLDALEGDRLQRPVALGVYQGLRVSEIARLNEADLDMERGELTVRISKTAKPRTIPLHQRIYPYLPDSPGRNGLPVATHARDGRWSPKSLSGAFRRFIDREFGAEWEDVHFHTLRHTCASLMAASGNFTLYQIASFLGHSQVSTTERYAHLIPTDLTLDW